MPGTCLNITYLWSLCLVNIRLNFNKFLMNSMNICRNNNEMLVFAFILFLLRVNLQYFGLLMLNDFEDIPLGKIIDKVE